VRGWEGRRRRRRRSREEGGREGGREGTGGGWSVIYGVWERIGGRERWGIGRMKERGEESNERVHEDEEEENGKWMNVEACF
jgi:hypothetical protein